MPVAHGEGNYYARARRARRARGQSPGRVPLYERGRRGRPTPTIRTVRSTTSPASAIAQRNVVGLMPHPERASEACARQRRRPRRAGVGGQGDCHIAASIPSTMSVIDHRRSRAARHQAGRVRPHPAADGPRAQSARARAVFGDVVGALQLQELARPSQDAADHRPARRAGAGRERRRRRHRRRLVRGLQDRVAQPPVVHRAVSGRGHRRRRHHPRHLHDGRAARSRC